MFLKIFNQFQIFVSQEVEVILFLVELKQFEFLPIVFKMMYILIYIFSVF